MSNPTFVLDSDVIQQVSAILHKTAQDPLSGDYIELCVRGNQASAADIYRILIARGYDANQLAQWDDLATFALDQATYWVLMRAPGFGGLDIKFVQQFDRRKELAELVCITIGGVATPPGGGSGTGGISHGRSPTFDHLNRRHRHW
jgi:hypothetical protein